MTIRICFAYYRDLKPYNPHTGVGTAKENHSRDVDLTMIPEEDFSAVCTQIMKDGAELKFAGTKIYVPPSQIQGIYLVKKVN